MRSEEAASCRGGCRAGLSVALQGRRDSDAAELYPSVQVSLVGLS